MEQLTLEQVIRAYADTVYRLAYAHMRNPSDADDVFQDVFLKYAEKAPAFASEEHRKAWLIRVTVNRCRSHFRSSWWRKIVPLADAEQHALPRPAEPQLDEALAKLPARYRSLLHLFYFENYDCGEIAELTGQNASTVRSGMTRARRALGKLLEGDENDVQ